MKMESEEGVDGRGPFCDRLSLIAECERDRGKLAKLAAALQAGDRVHMTSERAGRITLGLDESAAPRGGGGLKDP
jgi:hypothetical protein